jgi:beta-phosphoglucomutase-like phosphatase (HAD superfamily)
MTAATDEKPAVASLSDTEKELGSAAPDKFAGFEDPDAGLSEEEKAKIVCPAIQTTKHNIPATHAFEPGISSFCRSLQLLTASCHIL